MPSLEKFKMDSDLLITESESLVKNCFDALINLSSFEELKILEPFIVTDKIILLRKPAVQQRYDEDRQEAQNLGLSNASVVRTDVFQSNRKKYVYKQTAALVQNIYPSHLPSDTEHWNIWIDELNLSPNYIAEVKQYFFNVMGWIDNNAITWEKLPQHRSVPEIRHWHIFVKKVKTS